MNRRGRRIASRARVWGPRRRPWGRMPVFRGGGVASAPLAAKRSSFWNRLEAGPMETRLTLRPGMPGTKKLQARFGDRLVCVRYVYDKERRRRLKTVELVV